jgi:hypothetical protein
MDALACVGSLARAESSASAGTYKDATECIDAHGLRVGALRSLARRSSYERGQIADSLLTAASVRCILMAHKSAISARLIRCHRSTWTGGGCAEVIDALDEAVQDAGAKVFCQIGGFPEAEP